MVNIRMLAFNLSVFDLMIARPFAVAIVATSLTSYELSYVTKSTMTASSLTLKWQHLPLSLTALVDPQSESDMTSLISAFLQYT